MNRCFTDLARIKLQLRKLEEQAKKMETRCIVENGTPGKIETKYGTLVFNQRENWKVTDKDAVVNSMGVTEFIARATINFSQIKDFGGQNYVTQLKDEGAVELSSISQFYSLRNPKE